MSQGPSYQWQPQPEPTKRTSTWKVLGGLAVVIVVVGAIGAIVRASSDDTDTSSASATTTRPAIATTTQTSRAVTTTPPPPTVVPSGAATATEAGCEEPDPQMVDAITASLTGGRTLTDVAALTRNVDGIEYVYIGGNVLTPSGSRDRSGVVWLSPGVGVMAMSSSAEDVSTLPSTDPISDFDVYAGDDYFSDVVDCTSRLARGN